MQRALPVQTLFRPRPRSAWLKCFVALGLPVALLLIVTAAWHRHLNWSSLGLGADELLQHAGCLQNCSKQSLLLQFQRAKNGVCEAHAGWVPIKSKHTCNSAAHDLGLSEISATVIDLPDLLAGCYHVSLAGAGSSESLEGVLWLGVDREGHSTGENAMAVPTHQRICEGTRRPAAVARRLRAAGAEKEEAMAASDSSIHVKMIGPTVKSAKAETTHAKLETQDNIRVKVMGPSKPASTQAAEVATTTRPSTSEGAHWHNGQNEVWPPTPDPWLAAFGTTTEKPSERPAVVLPFAGIITASIICCLVCTALAFVVCHWSSELSYNRIPFATADVVKPSRSREAGQEQRKPEDLFFRAADLADRILVSSRGPLAANEVSKELLHLQELEKLREQVAACPSHGDADRRRLALAAKALDVATRARTLASWWAPKPLLAMELTHLRQECIRLGIFDNRIVALPKSLPKFEG